MPAPTRSIQISLLAVLLLSGTAALADPGYVKVDVPRGYQGGLARDQAAFVTYPVGANVDFGVTVFDGLSQRTLVDDDNFRTNLVVSNQLVAWAGPPDLFSYDGHEIANLTPLDDNYYLDIAVDRDRVAWARLNPETFSYDIVLRENGRERTITHDLFAGTPQLSGDNGAFNAGDLYYFSAPANRAKVALIPNDPNTDNGQFRISGHKVVWISRTFFDPNEIFPVSLKIYDGGSKRQRTLFTSSQAAVGPYGIPIEVDGFSYPNALFLSGTAPGVHHEFLIDVRTGKVTNIEDAISTALDAELAFPPTISGDYVAFVAQTPSFESIVGTYQISKRTVKEIARFPAGTLFYGQVWSLNANLAIATQTEDATQLYTSTGHIYYQLGDYIALVRRALKARNEPVKTKNRLSGRLHAIASASDARRGGRVLDFLADVQADHTLSDETRGALIEVGHRIQDALP